MTGTMIRKPRVAYVMTPITFGGAEKVNLNFLKKVNRDQFDIDHILFLRPWEKETVVESELKRHGLYFISIPVTLSRRFDAFRIIRCFRLLKQLLQSHSYDLIHTHGYLADILGFFAAKYLKIPIISTCHGYICQDAKLSLYNYLDCLVLRGFSRVITVSKSIRDELIRKGVERNRITVIENCPQIGQPDHDRDLSRDTIRRDNLIGPQELAVGYVGRLSREKGISYLVEAIALLKDSAIPLKLLIIGEGPQTDELKSLAATLDVAGKIRFTGFQSNIDEWLAAIDILVLPSLTEGSPMILLEAMAHGVPCIASAVGGIPQIINPGIDGIMVTPGKPGEIRDALSFLCAYPGRREIISNNAQQKIIRKYNVTDWTSKIEGEYLNAILM